MALFDRFFRSFQQSGDVPVATAWPESVDIPGLDLLMASSTGATFSDGLYRLHTSDSSLQATAWLADGFPAFSGAIRCFGYDWLGRQFAVDMRDQTTPTVLLFEPGTGQVLEIPGTFVDFHNNVLVDEREPALAVSFFDDWRRTKRRYRGWIVDSLPEHGRMLGQRQRPPRSN